MHSPPIDIACLSLPRSYAASLPFLVSSFGAGPGPPFGNHRLAHSGDATQKRPLDISLIPAHS